MPLWLTLYRNSAWREGIGIDFCIGQFDTTAWRSSDRSAAVQQSGGYCWSFYCHVTRLLLLRWLLEIFRSSTKARARHNFRRLELTNSNRAFVVQVALQEKLTAQLQLDQPYNLILSLLVRIRHKVVWLWSRSAVANAVQS